VSKVITQVTWLVLVSVTTRSAVAVDATVLGPVTATEIRFGTQSVGAAAELGAAEVALADADTDPDGVGEVVGMSVAVGVALVSTTCTDAVVAGAAVVERPRIADTMATMIAITTTSATSTTPRRRQ
jgi:hypothetical protein